MRSLTPTRSLLLVGACALGACGSSHVPPPPVEGRPALTASASSAPPPVRSEDLARRLCGDRSPCSVRRNRPAGRAPDGVALNVVSLDLGVHAADDSTDAAPGPGGDLQEEERVDTTMGPSGTGFACHAYEYWLVTGAPSVAPRLLAKACNDGYGAAGVGQDVITVGDNAFTLEHSGGSNWRWGSTHKLTLAPLRILSTTSEGRWTVGPNTEETSWDWEKFKGTVTWYSPPCEADGVPPPADSPRGADYEYLPIPRVEIEAAFRDGGFRDVALGACAVDIDGTGDRGHLFGEKTPREAASLRAVLSKQDELFIEVRDAQPSGASARWVADDHVELWLSSTQRSYSNQCLAPAEAPAQWGIRIADGKVFAGYGSPRTSVLVVERAAKDAGVVRFRVGLPKGIARITVAYSDGDGRRQRSLFGTSAAKKGLSESLGAPFDVRPTSAVCRARDGRLEPVLTYAPPPDRPFADDGEED